MHARRGLMLCILFFVLQAAPWKGGEAAADGVMMPPLVVNKLPDMPSQRAILVHRDGVETLVIESLFDGPGKEMAWILPVPAAPSSIAETDSGLFTVLALNLQPQVEDTASAVLGFGVFIVVWALFLLAAGRFVPFRALAMTLLVMMGLVKSISQFAVLGDTIGDREVPGVHSSGALSVGDYEVHVLEADAAGALSAWLRANGFRDLPEEGKPIAGDYVAKKWRFVVTRLHRDSEGLSKPKPLKLSFAAEQPVYPLRLTQLDTRRLHLELFVIGDKEAVARSMHTAYADSFRREPATEFSGLREKNRGNTFWNSLGLPALLDLMGETCVVTRLKADLSRGDMREDLYLDWKQCNPARDTVYTARGARLTGLSWALLVGGIALGVGTSIHYWRRKRGVRRFGPRAVVMTSLLLGGVVYGSARVLLPQAEVLQAHGGQEQKIGPKDVISQLHAYPDVLARMGFKEIQDYFADALAGRENPYTGEPFRLEAAPGGITLEETPDGVVMRSYDMSGAPLEEQVTGSRLPGLLREFREHPEDKERREKAITGYLGSQEWCAFPEIQGLFHDAGEPALRGIAVDALTDLLTQKSMLHAGPETIPEREQQSISLLMAALEDPDARVRGKAECAMGKLGARARAAIPVLARLIDDTAPGLGKGALDALGHMGKEALPVWLPRIAKTQPLAIRTGALKALARLGPEAEETVPALMELLKEEPEAKHPKVRINEIVCVGSRYPDEDRDTPDWFELYNEKEEAINLEGWSVTDDKANPRKWVFPAVSIAVDGYLVPYASGKNRRPADPKRLHTNFELNDQGGEISLFDAQGTLVDTMAFPAGQPGSSWSFEEDERIGEVTAQALSRMGASALPVLTAALRDPGFPAEGRAMAAQAIGRMKDKGRTALPDLLAEIENPDLDMRVEVISAVAMLSKDTNEVPPALLAASQDPRPKIRDTAQMALNYLDLKRFPTPSESRWTDKFQRLAYSRMRE